LPIRSLTHALTRTHPRTHARKICQDRTQIVLDVNRNTGSF